MFIHSFKKKITPNLNTTENLEKTKYGKIK